MSVTESDPKSFSGDQWLSSKEKREEPEQLLMGIDIKPKEAEQSERSTAKRSDMKPWDFLHVRLLESTDPMPAIECLICCAAHYTSSCPYLVEIPPGVTIRNDTGFEISDGNCGSHFPANIGPRKVVRKPFNFLPPPPRD